MILTHSGTWWLRSESDKRWRAGGHVDALAFSAGMHPDAQQALDELKTKYGEPPEDLEYGGMKD